MEKNINFAEWNLFFKKMDKAAHGGFEKELSKFNEGLGIEFLQIVQDEIIRKKVVNTRLLLSSFQKAGGNNIFEMKSGGFVLEVGTNLEYASYVNNGHWTCKKGEMARWIPGYWNGDNFIYQSGAKTGMYLKQKWISGAHYWESALRIMEKLMPEVLEAKLQNWLDSYF